MKVNFTENLAKHLSGFVPLVSSANDVIILVMMMPFTGNLNTGNDAIIPEFPVYYYTGSFSLTVLLYYISTAFSNTWCTIPVMYWQIRILYDSVPYI